MKNLKLGIEAKSSLMPLFNLHCIEAMQMILKCLECQEMNLGQTFNSLIRLKCFGIFQFCKSSEILSGCVSAVTPPQILSRLMPSLKAHVVFHHCYELMVIDLTILVLIDSFQ